MALLVGVAAIALLHAFTANEEQLASEAMPCIKETARGMWLAVHY